MSNNKKDLTLEDDIISYLRDRRSGYTTTRKDIQNEHKDYANKKDVKHALKRLVKRRVIEKDGKSYAYNINNSNTSQQHHIVSIGQSMRTVDDDEQTIKSHDNEDDIKLPKNMDLDEEIARLEAELAADNSESDDDISDEDIQDSECDDNSEDDAPNNKKTISFGQDSIHEYADQSKSQTQNHHVHDNNSNGIICLSNLANDRIEPLPQSALPQNKRKVLKGIDRDDDIDEGSMSKKRKKQRRQQDKEEHTVSEGLKSAVQDLLQNYVRPSQLDRPPFYCRVCQHQSKSQSEFDTHRQSEFHTVAVKEEKKKTYCKLCRKQLTSVIQMEEHLKSKPHRDRMDYMKGKQRGLIGGGNRSSDGGGRGRGRGSSWQSNGRGRGTRNDSSGRQWC